MHATALVGSRRQQCHAPLHPACWQIEKYFAAAVPTMREFRSAMRLGPLDKLRLELDEVWPHGASVTKDPSGRPFVAGLVRVMVSSTTHGPSGIPDR